MEKIKILPSIRKKILLELKNNKISWAGKLSDVDFLLRIYDLDSMDSMDSMHQNATQEIRKNTNKSFKGWPKYWVFDDTFHFNLPKCSDEEYLTFLCEMINPYVRPDQNEQESLLLLFNKYIKESGYEIVKDCNTLGNVEYKPKDTFPQKIDDLDAIRNDIVFTTENINRNITRIKTNIKNDPELAIGSAKELVESLCKRILEGQDIKNNTRLSDLTKLALEKLLEHDSLSNSMNQITRSLLFLVQTVGEMRNKYGTGHGKGKDHTVLDQKYTLLVINSALTVALFLFHSYKENNT